MEMFFNIIIEEKDLQRAKEFVRKYGFIKNPEWSNRLNNVIKYHVD